MYCVEFDHPTSLTAKFVGIGDTPAGKEGWLPKLTAQWGPCSFCEAHTNHQPRDCKGLAAVSLPPSSNAVAASDQLYTGHSDPSHFLMHVLSFLETPPHLRKTLFPMHPNLRTAGTLPSLDMPHHLRADEECLYREGVTLSQITSSSQDHDARAGDDDDGKERKTKKRKKSRTLEEASTERTIINAGLHKKALVDVSIPPNTRVTLRFSDLSTISTNGSNYKESKEKELIHAEAVHPSTPREESGYYWGYLTRRASSLSNIFTECPYEEGYDLSIGTSERGTPLDDILPSIISTSHVPPPPTTSDNDTLHSTIDDEAQRNPTKNGSNKNNRNRRFKHMIIIIGGPAGLESALTHDAKLRDIPDVRQKGVGACFDYYVDLCSGMQGSRTIRSVEAVWIALSRLKGFIDSNSN